VATTIKVWEIVGSDLMPAKGDSLAASHVEAELETWIAKNPELLGDKLLIIEGAGMGKLQERSGPVPGPVGERIRACPSRSVGHYAGVAG
jgi:hypothetical protein